MVKIKTPVIKRITPPIFDIKLIFFLKFLENNKNLWIKYPDKTKGIASPNEYKINNMTALVKVSSIDAKAKIEPKIGPIHGVQPKPKATPITYGKRIFLYPLASNLFSKFK